MSLERRQHAARLGIEDSQQPIGTGGDDETAVGAHRAVVHFLHVALKGPALPRGREIVDRNALVSRPHKHSAVRPDGAAADADLPGQGVEIEAPLHVLRPVRGGLEPLRCARDGRGCRGGHDSKRNRGGSLGCGLRRRSVRGAGSV